MVSQTMNAIEGKFMNGSQEEGHLEMRVFFAYRLLIFVCLIKHLENVKYCLNHFKPVNPSVIFR